MIGGQIKTFGIPQTMKASNSFPGPDSLRKNNYKTAAVLLACTAAVAGKAPLLYTSLSPSFQLQHEKGKEIVTAIMGEMVLCCVTERGREKLTDLQDVCTTHYTVLQCTVL